MPPRLEPKDDFTHVPSEESNFNESMYFNMYDPAARLGGFFRIGNRVNEGRAEMTACLYLPDGRVGFTFARPRISTNDRFDAGGMRFQVIRPLEELTISYDGPLTLLADPLEMSDPKEAFTNNPAVACSVDLRYTATAPPMGGERESTDERLGEEFARAHYEQLVAASGSVVVGDQSWAVNGFGLRDHSWGPRSWQAPWYYRWLVGNGAEFGFMGSRSYRRNGDVAQGGFIWDGGKLHLSDRCEIATTWTSEDDYHKVVDLTIFSGTKEWAIRGEVLNLIPLRNRRDDMVTRISEGLTEWKLADGRVAHGLSEYLDQIVEGRPVGLVEQAG
jgi:hypothetical protein